jgi:hypothetical protein
VSRRPANGSYTRDPDLDTPERARLLAVLLDQLSSLTSATVITWQVIGRRTGGHDDHQIVYAGRGVLAITTSAGSWVTPGNRAIFRRTFGETPGTYQ